MTSHSEISDPPRDRLGAAPVGRAAWPELPWLLCAFVAVWTLYSSFTALSGVLHNDVMEAYVWGQEFRPGYNQHPPVWSWIAGAWFLVFPRATWAFALLAYVNAAIGLYGAWKLVGNFAAADARKAATVLLLLTPFYSFLALKYNANSIFLSIWPWTAHCFVRSYRSLRLADAFAFGVMLALAMLSKYFALILGFTCFAASLIGPERGRYYRSAAPYVAAATGAVLCLPHAWWLLHSGAPPFRYFASTTHHTAGEAIRYAIQTLVGAVLFQVVVAAAILIASPASPGRLWRTARARWRDPEVRRVATLLLLPIVLTALAGAMFRTKVSTNMLVGVFPLAPLFLMELAGPRDSGRLLRVAQVMVAALTLGALALSPAVAYAKIWLGHDGNDVEPRRELAIEATRLWHESVGRPLVYVGGATDYANALAFYGPDRPHVFMSFDSFKAPWVTRADLARDGLLAICVAGDQSCLAAAQPFVSPDSKRAHLTVTHRFWGVSRTSVSFDLILSPPQA